MADACLASRADGSPCTAPGVPRFGGYCVGHRPDRKEKRGLDPSSALSAVKVRNVKVPGMYADGNGLYLRVTEAGNKRWVQRLMVRGKRRNLGLGSWPRIPLAEAREQALANWRTVRDGRDPLVDKRRESVPTVAEAAVKVIDLNRPTWTNAKHVYQWQMSFSNYVNPYIGEMLVSEVTPADVLAALSPIWTSKHDTAARIRQRIGTVMDWAVAQGYRADNPAGQALARVLPKMPKVQAHQAAIPYGEVPAALRAVCATDADAATKLSLEFLVLTATRSTETRLATWPEIDWQAQTWTVPAERMKGRKGQRREHRVPLSSRALEVLAKARCLDNGSGLLFPSPTTGRPISDNTHRKRLRDLGLQAADGRLAVPHGFRSSFRDWASECTDTPHAVMEAALAHVVSNATEAAYARSDLFERRRVLMQQWADYLEGAEAVPEASTT